MFIKVQRSNFFCHGRGENHRKCLWDFVRKQLSSFRAWSMSWSQFKTSFDPWWRLQVGGRWGAIDVLCEALFGELFRISRAPHFMRRKFSKALPEPFGGLLEPSRAFQRGFREKYFFISLSFFMKVQQQIFFVMGEAKFLTTSSETSSGKRRLYFEPWPCHGLNLERHSTLSEGSILLMGTR